MKRTRDETNTSVASKEEMGASMGTGGEKGPGGGSTAVKAKTR